MSLFASDSPDRFAIDDLWERLSTTMSPEELRSVERHDVANVQGFLDHASRVDLMVASRLHGVLLAQLVGTPVIALSYDRKVDVQMESVGQSSFRLSVDAIEFDAQFQDVLSAVVPTSRPHEQQIQARFSEVRAQLEVQYDCASSLKHPT